jgi:hypothetical protein
MKRYFLMILWDATGNICDLMFGATAEGLLALEIYFFRLQSN